MAPLGDDVVVSNNVKLEKLFCMKGGKGESSYANNSQAQAGRARSMLHLLEEALDKVQLSSSEVPFQVVDLGCSSSNNTIYIIDVIIKHITKRCESSDLDPPEFAAFFFDLPSNDFNTLFQLLLPMVNHGGSMEECLAASGRRNYFAAGVPGTFYQRLFPVPENAFDKKSTGADLVLEGQIQLGPSWTIQWLI